MEESNLEVSFSSLSSKSSPIPTLKQSAGLETNDFYLKESFGDNISDVGSDSSDDVKTGRKSWKNTEAYQNQNESEVEENVPHESKYSTSLQTFRKLKPPRTSKNPPLLYIKQEIKSIIGKIVFLRKCYISIQRHQSVFVSEEFAYRQRKWIREYQILIERENFRLYEMLRQYKLTSQDITSLIKCVNLRALHEDQYEIHKKRLLLTQATRNAIKADINNIEYFISDRLNQTSAIGDMPSKSYPHCNATEMSENNLDKEVGSKRKENKPDKLVTAASKSGKKTIYKREIKYFISDRFNHANAIGVMPSKRYPHCNATEMSEKNLDKEGEIGSERSDKQLKEELEGIILIPENKPDKLITAASKNGKKTIDKREIISKPNNEKSEKDNKPEENLIISSRCDEKVIDKKWNGNKKANEKKSKKEWKRTVSVQENKPSDKFVTETTEDNRKILHTHFDAKAEEVKKEHRETKKFEGNVNDVKIDLGECPRKSKQKEKDTRKKFFSFLYLKKN